MDVDLRPLLDRVPGVQAVYAFGSRASEDARPDSDLDLALLAAAPLAPLARWDAQEALAAAVGADVDLVDLWSASTVMRAEVLRSGRVVLDLDPAARAFWETWTMSAYARLNEERAGILDDIRHPEGTALANGAGSMPDDVILNKAATIERCLARVRAETASPDWVDDATRQDAAVLNLQRACQAAIDLAMRRARTGGLGVPQTSRDAFRLLVESGSLAADLGDRMQRMVGFRNVAVHDTPAGDGAASQALSVPILQSIVASHLGDFEAFVAWALAD